MDVAIQVQHRNHPVYDPSLEPLLFSTTPLQLIIKAISPKKQVPAPLPNKPIAISN
jgi:hypothetical protein